MKKTLSLLAILALGFTACNKFELQETSEQTPAEAPVCYFNLPASFDGDGATKAVTIGESTATTTFEAEDKIYVYIERAGKSPAYGSDDSSTNLVPLTIDNIDNTDGATCDLSGALVFYQAKGGPIEPYTPQANDIVHLLYNQNGHEEGRNYPYFDYYRITGGKDDCDPQGGENPNHFFWGANHFDFAEAVMKVTAVSGNDESGYSLTLGKVDDPTNTRAGFKNLQSLFRQRISFTDADGNPVNPTITRFRIRSSNRSVVERYYPFESDNSPFYKYFYQGLRINDPVISGDGDIYFPLMFNDVNKNDALIFTAYDDAENVYTVTKNAPAGGFANGKYYYGDASLAWHHNMRPTVTGTSATPSSDEYTIGENPVNITISGYSEGYRFKSSHGGTVTLNNATADTHSEPFIHLVASSAKELHLVLTGTNSIESKGYNCIKSDGTSTLKLSCTGASATLTVTVNDDWYCGLEGANYTISNDSSDPTANRYDITTERDVTAQLAAPGYTVTRSARKDNLDGTFTWTYTVSRIPTNLSSLTSDYTAQDGDVLTGELQGSYKISIADGATVTLAGITINGGDDWEKAWAGITCEGDATLVLADGTSNLVKHFYQQFAAISVPSGKTLTIQGSGSLTADARDEGGAGIGGNSSQNYGNIIINGAANVTAYGGVGCAGIGSGFTERHRPSVTGGDITINTSGTVKAYGGPNAAGIGSGYGARDNDNRCGNILISKGTVEAIGGEEGAGIGTGRTGLGSTVCGTISITDGVTSVTATKGTNGVDCIGCGKSGTCGTVTIDGTTSFSFTTSTTQFSHFNSALSTTTNENDTWTLTHK